MLNLNINCFTHPILKLSNKSAQVISHNKAFEEFKNDYNEKYQNLKIDQIANKILILKDKRFKLEKLDHEDEYQNWVQLIDVTEKFNLNEENRELMNSKTFEHKLLSLGEMAAGIAHDINNPLSIILSNSEILNYIIKELVEEFEEKDIYDKLSYEAKDNFEDFKESLDSIQEASNRAANIVEGMRIFSRKNKGNSKKTNIIHTIKNSISFCYSNLENRHIDIQFDDKQHSYLEIFGEEVFLYQIFVNLINNARDAVENLGELNKWIKIKIKENDDPDYITIQVIDGGSGIAQDIQNKIMNPFFTTKDAGKGTGLGLSICTKLLAEQGGKLRINNDLANTCFEIILPKKEVELEVPMIDSAA